MLKELKFKLQNFFSKKLKILSWKKWNPIFVWIIYKVLVSEIIHPPFKKKTKKKKEEEDKEKEKEGEEGKDGKEVAKKKVYSALL